MSISRIVEGHAYQKIIYRAIRNKIVDKANEVLNMYGTPIWNNIKKNLIIHYADLQHSIKQNSENVEQFYAKIIEVYSTMANNIRVHENNKNVIQSKINLYEELCL